MYKLTVLTQAEFEAYSKTIEKGSFFLTPEMAALKVKRNHPIHFLGLQNNKQEVVMATIITAFHIRIGTYFDIDGGFLTNTPSLELTEAFLTEIMTYAKNHHAMFLQIDPNLIETNSDQKEYPETTPYVTLFTKAGFTSTESEITHSNDFNPIWVYKKDLTGLDEKSLTKSYKKNARYNLKKAHEFGVTFRRLSFEEIPYFKILTEAVSERRGFTDKTLQYYQEVYETYGENAWFTVAEISLSAYLAKLTEQLTGIHQKMDKVNAALALSPDSKKQKTEKKALDKQLAAQLNRIEDAKKIIEKEPEDVLLLASALFLFSNFETIYLFSGTNDDYSQFYAPYLIQDEIMRETIRRQIPIYNFYGISGVFDGSDGVLRFKESFDGYNEKLVAPLRKVLSIKYTIFKTLKHVLGK
jgi:alanine adding enzyme